MGVTGRILVTEEGDYAVLLRGLRLLVADLQSVLFVGPLSPEQSAQLAAAERLLAGGTSPPQLGQLSLLSLGELAYEAMAYANEVDDVTGGSPPDRLVLLRQLALNTAAYSFAEACKGEGISVRAPSEGEMPNAGMVVERRKGS